MARHLPQLFPKLNESNTVRVYRILFVHNLVFSFLLLLGYTLNLMGGIAALFSYWFLGLITLGYWILGIVLIYYYARRLSKHAVTSESKLEV